MFGAKINKQLLPMKGHYFLFNAGTAPVVPFMSTFARQLGFSSFIVGIIYTILPIAGMLAKPLMGAIADKYRCQKIIFLVVQLITALSFLAMSFTPNLPVDTKIHFACDSEATLLDTCVNNITIDDDCALDNIKTEAGLNRKINCELHCPFTRQDWDIVCHQWNATQYCDTNSSKLDFTAHFTVADSEHKGHCLYFHVESVTLQDDKTYYPSCSSPKNKISTDCDMKCDFYGINDRVTQTSVSDSNIYTVHQFWILLTIFIVCWVSQAVVVSIGDAICFEMLGDAPHKYGQQRLYGALGWGIFSAIAGFMLDYFSEGQSKKNYASVFFTGMAILILDFVVSSKIQFKQQNLSASILRDVGRILADVRVCTFLLWCVCMGMCTGLIWQFLFWLLEDLAAKEGCWMQEWIKTLEGLVMAIQCLLGELPFFFLSGWILERIGHVHAMSLVAVVIGARYILYSLISNPWFFLPIELSNGLTFGLFYATMASYASIVAPPGTEATMQGFVGAVFEGVGVSLGSFIGGLLYTNYGGPMTFRLFGIGSLIFALLHIGVQYFLQHRDSVPGKGGSKNSIKD